ncbi:ISXO2-like transposase domain protein [mine drainage metagenome]|uniref:ISXO2-like transposase domain protein n=1 Tax=mine drainage metagenome TaxID=410659 RepID=A0A1J5RXZ2_9ZZZZ
MFKNLHELIATMPDEKSCRDYLIKERWNGVPVCPYCESEKSYLIEDGKRFKCGSCLKKYSVTVGTIFHASNIKLNKWLMAVYILSSHKKGISSYQLGKDIGVAQKTAWFMMHRIRKSLSETNPEMLDNTVEVDEVWIGGKMKNKHVAVRKKAHEDNISHSSNKVGVIGMLERQGNIKLQIIDRPLKQMVKENVSPDAVIITDSLNAYSGLNKQHKAHEVVSHINDEFVRGEFHTNSIEGFWSIMKRGIYGIYHQVSPEHLHRYCDEFSYRYNTRKMKDADRFVLTLQGIEKRLTYKDLVSHGKNNQKRIEAQNKSSE